MPITTKMILALALAAAGIGYFQIISASDRDGGAASVAVLRKAAEAMRTVSDARNPPFFVAGQR